MLASQGILALLCREPVPTPAVSSAVIQRKLDGAINVTASHNSGEYSGLKFSTADGAPARPEVTLEIEKEIERLQVAEYVFQETFDPTLIETVEIRDDYLGDLAAKVNLGSIRDARLMIGYDALHGVGAGYLDRMLAEQGIDITLLHANRDVYFGGRHPEPSEDNLGQLRQLVKRKALQIGLSTDGDADRFGVLDRDGTFIHPNELIAMLVDYLAESRNWKGGVARTVATTHLVDRVARSRGLEVLETPVGFKYISEYIKEGRILLGGEESGGLSIRGHLPEKDGILACLLATEMVASRRQSLSEQLRLLFQRVGPVYNRRLNIRLDPAMRGSLEDKLASQVRDFYGRRVLEENRVDGLKLLFEDGGWVLMRLSGTEPVVRYYAESSTLAELEQLLELGKQWIRKP